MRLRNLFCFVGLLLSVGATAIAHAADPVGEDISVRMNQDLSSIEIQLVGSDADGDSLTFFLTGLTGKVIEGYAGATAWSSAATGDGLGDAMTSTLRPAPGSSGNGFLSRPRGENSGPGRIELDRPIDINTNESDEGFTFEGIYHQQWKNSWVTLFYLETSDNRDLRVESYCGTPGFLLRFTFSDNNDGNPGFHAVHQRFATGTKPCDSGTYHVAATYDGGKGEDSIVLYVDGEEYPSTYSNPENPYVGCNNVDQGCSGGNEGSVDGLKIQGKPKFNGDGDGGWEEFEGLTDEVRLWNRALSAADIMRYSRRELTGTEDGLVYYNRFNIEDVFASSGVSYVINHASGSTPHGTVSIAANIATYTPTANPPVNDYFLYRITDRMGVSWEYEVLININTAPTAAAQSASGDEDAIQTISLSGSDPDGDTLSYVIASQPSHGTVSLEGSTVTYTPTADYSGSDSFTFTVSDGMVTSSAATVSITVNSNSLVGDFNLDGSVGFADFFQFADIFGARDLSPEQTRFDLDGDSIVGFSDFFIFVENFGQSLP